MNVSFNFWICNLKKLFDGAFFVPFLSKGLQSSSLYWIFVICEDDQKMKKQKRLKRDKTCRDIDANGENRGIKTIS